MAAMLPCRLVLFFARVRDLAPQWHWRFALITTAQTQWTEENIHARGWPGGHIYCLEVTADCPIPGGCLTAHRAVNHHHAAKFFATEATRVVNDIQSEFAPRLRQPR